MKVGGARGVMLIVPGNGHGDTKLKKAQKELASIYLKELTEYIQNPIEMIRDSVEDRQPRKAWQTINEVRRRKSAAKAKLKATNQQERIKLWKQHFENLLGNPPKVTPEPITRIISKQFGIQVGLFTVEELDSLLRKIKNRKAKMILNKNTKVKVGSLDGDTDYFDIVAGVL